TPWALAIVFVALLVQNQIVHEAADAPEDRAGRLRTTYLVLGPRLAALAALAPRALVALASIWLLARDGSPLAIALHALPFVTVFPWLEARRGAAPSFMARVRAAHRLASATSGGLLFAVHLVN